MDWETRLKTLRETTERIEQSANELLEESTRRANAPCPAEPCFNCEPVIPQRERSAFSPLAAALTHLAGQ